jgi:hypothetical protein
MDDARGELLDLQRLMLDALAGAAEDAPLWALVATPLRADLCGYVRARHLVNVREALSQWFPVTASALALDDAQLRRHVPRLAPLGRPEARLAQLHAGLAAAIHILLDLEHVHMDVLGFEYARALARVRGPAQRERILAVLEHATLTDAPLCDLGVIIIQRARSNAPELFDRHDPRDARPLGWPRWIVHLHCEGWSRPRWFETNELRKLRIRVIMAG